MAMQMLEKHRGNLTDAVNSYFLEEDTHKYGNVIMESRAAKSCSFCLTTCQDSKTDTAGASSSQQMDVLKDSSDHELPQSHSQRQDDYDLACAVFMSLKWGGISSEELNEALLAETALFGEISNHSSQNFSSLPDLQHHPEQNVDPETKCLSTSMSQLSNDSRLLKQQEDAEYLESLRADKQNELNSLNKAESHSSKEEESCKKMLEEKELGKMLDKKEVRLPKEPPLSDEVITIVVRMPDGGRCERRFLKTDKLEDSSDHELPQSHSQQQEDDYDLDRAFFKEYAKRAQAFTIVVHMPDGRCIYRHFLKTDKLKVKQFPRRGYSIEDSSSTFDEIGLSNDEALYVEKI